MAMLAVRDMMFHIPDDAVGQTPFVERDLFDFQPVPPTGPGRFLL
jgi:hypothetical protein